MTSQTSLSAISSPASADGATPYDWLDGPTADLFGPAPAPANPSATPAKRAARKTSAISGRTFSGSSASAALQSSLASRLQARMASPGWILFRLTWKVRTTPLGRRICALRASGHRTSGNAYGSWPTPMAQTPAQNGNNMAGNCDSSRRTVALCGRPTAAALDWRDGRSNQHGKNSRPLNEVAMLATWATPVRSPAGGTAQGFINRKLKAIARGVQMGASLTDLGLQANGLSASTASGGQLNPAHARWLMGYPPAWDACAVTAMPSSRKSRRSS